MLNIHQINMKIHNSYRI